MKFVCEKDTLVKEIAIAQEIISSKNIMSILSNVLFEAKENTLFIKATDLKVSFETKIPVEVAEEGSITLFCDTFLSVLRTLPSGDIEFEEKDNDVFVIKPLFKKKDIRLKTISSEKYPEMPVPGKEKFFEFSQKDILEMISQTIFAVSDDETRYYMNGIYLEKNDDCIIMVATDGRRLSYISKKAENSIPDFKPIIIPPKALSLVKKLSSGEGNISIAINEKNIFFQFNNQKITSSLIDGTFPNYQKVIPDKQKYKITVGREDLVEALKMVSQLAEQKSGRICVNLKNKSFFLSSEETERGFAEEDVA